MVSAAFDGSVKVWTHKGIEITTLYCHKQRVNTCFISIPGKSDEATSNWADIVSEEEEEGSKPSKVKLDEISIVTASDDGTVGVWKPFLPNQLTSLVGHSDRVLSVAATLNNSIVSSSLDGAIQLWSPTLSLSMTDTLSGHTGPITSSSCFTVSQHLTYYVTGGRDGYIIVWEINSDSENGDTRSPPRLEKLYQIKDSDKAVSSVCFVNFIAAKNEGTIAVGRDDGSMNIYRFIPSEYPSVDSTLSSGALMGGHPISKLVLTPDLKNVVAGSWSNRVATIGGNRRVSGRMEMHKSWVMDIVATKEKGKSSSVVYSIALDGTLCEWGELVNSYTVLAQSGDKDPAWPLAMCEVLTNSGTIPPYLAISDSKGILHLWNKGLKKIDLVKKLHQKAIHSVAVMPNGELVTGSEDGIVKLWRMEGRSGPPNLKQVGQFHCQSGVTAITVVDSGKGSSKNLKPLVLVGDQLGHVTLLQWHQ